MSKKTNWHPPIPHCLVWTTFVCFSIKFMCKHYALLPHGGELVSDMSHIATSAQNRADASIAGGQHAAFAFSTRNQKHLFSNPGMLSNLVLRHWRVYRVWSHWSVEMKMLKIHCTWNKHKQILKDLNRMTLPAASVVAEDTVQVAGKLHFTYFTHGILRTYIFRNTHSSGLSQLWVWTGKSVPLAFKSESDLSFAWVHS